MENLEVTIRMRVNTKLEWRLRLLKSQSGEEKDPDDLEKRRREMGGVREKQPERGPKNS